MESKEQYIANYLHKMKKYPDYVEKCKKFYLDLYGENFMNKLNKLLARAQK